MREARIILPTAGNDGVDLEPAHYELKRALLTRFGGYTAQTVFGGWRDPSGAVIEEQSMAYDVAVPDGSSALLREIAREAGHRAQQQAVYLRLATGEVEILDTSVRVANAA